jgi:hypothetical protein
MMYPTFRPPAHIGWRCTRIWHVDNPDMQKLLDMASADRKSWLRFISDLKIHHHPDSYIPYPGLLWDKAYKEMTPILVLEMWAKGWQVNEGSVRRVRICPVVGVGNGGMIFRGG